MCRSVPLGRSSREKLGTRDKEELLEPTYPIDASTLAASASGYKPEYLDLNRDGKPDAIKSVTHNDIPILWLDDDGNMKEGDLEGDMVNDCLLIDRNKDGIYGGQGDLIIDWVDTDGDGRRTCRLL